MTARLAAHPDVAPWAHDVAARLVRAGVDVELGPEGPGGGSADALERVRHASIDLALVGIHALRGSSGDGLTTVAVLPRGEVRDVLIPLQGKSTPLSQLPSGARVGVVSRRAEALLGAHRPDVNATRLDLTTPGDVIRRLAEIEREGSDGMAGIIVGALEARAAGLSDRAVEALEPKSWLPEPGKGALALIARHPIAEATALDHLPTRTALRTELALLDALDADPDATLGCLAQPSGRWIRLWAAAVSRRGDRLVRSDLTGPLDEPAELGRAVARQLGARGWALVTAS